MPFDDSPWRRSIEGIDVLFGESRIDEIGSLVRELGGRRVLLVADPGITKAGYCKRASRSIAEAGSESVLFDQVRENPTSRNVEDGVATARGADIDFLVGLGGGSAMDCAKGINILLTNGGSMADYRGFGRTTKPLLPSIGVPTTAGTGSEAQSYALITDSASHTKMACGDSLVRFRAVILDPTLTDSLPTATAAASGIDAVAHAVESYVTTRRTEESASLAREAWELLNQTLEPAIDSIGDRRLWGRMMYAAFLAGAAIERSMLGAAHACANPLTARFGTTHGVAVALMLPHVVRYNGPRAEALYADLAGERQAGETATDAVARRIELLRRALGLPARLRDVGVVHDALPDLADEASRQWTLGFNPRPALRDDLVRLYETAF
jgi:alcohol dehydrogenase